MKKSKQHWNLKTLPGIFLLVLIALLSVKTMNATGQNPAIVVRGERPTIDIASIPIQAIEPNIIRIKFSETMQDYLDNAENSSNPDGAIRFGIASIDVLNQQFGVFEVKKTFAAALQNTKFSDRHRLWGFHLWYDLVVPEGTDIKSMVKAYTEKKEIQVTEPVYRTQLFDTDINDLQFQSVPDGDKGMDYVPNDPRYSEQWHYNNTGQCGGTPDADIDLPEAWEITKGNSNVIVAVIDKGIDYTHEDLAGNMWPGIGWDFVSNTSTITPAHHGTHVAGTIAANTNNGLGVSGIAGGNGTGNGVRLMSCQVYTSSSSGGFENAPIWAADNGAAISQNSWGYTSPGYYNQVALDAIDYFNTHGGGSVLSGGISIFAAGNSGTSDQIYPACYSGAFSVAATNNQDKKADYSTYNTSVDISAPGGETACSVLSCLLGNSYGYSSGTSMACPHVSGVAALIISLAPGILTAQNVRDILSSTTDNIDGLNPAYAGQLGTGRLNAYQALLAAQGFTYTHLQPGWNLISFDVIPTTATPEAVFAPLISDSSLEMVTGFQNQMGVFFDPAGLPFLNTLTQLATGEGYWVKVIGETTLSVTGEPILPTFSINLKTGWNLVAYWPAETTTPAVAFADLITTGVLQMVTGYEQGDQFFDPNGLPSLNTLTEIKNGFGYWVKVSADYYDFSYTHPVWQCGSHFTDSRNGKVYPTVKIGDQCWIKQNLNIGTRIAGTTEQTNNNAIEKYCYDNLETNCDIYGGLYQWDEMMNYSTTPGVQGICPINWHLPTDAQWTKLTTYLGGESVAGGKMKETGTTHWISPNTGATNSSFFIGLPGGYRHADGSFLNLGEYGLFWSSTESSTADAWSRRLNYSLPTVYRSASPEGYGISVRCLKDTPTVTTSSISDTTQTTAISGGNVTSDGGATVTQRGVCWSTAPNPNIFTSKTIDGNGTGIFISNLTSLMPNTLYYARAYATNSFGTAYGELISFTTHAFPWACGSNFTDSRDGKVYTTVQIGPQCWIKKNLNIGTRIAGANNQTNNGTIEKYCYNNLETNCDIYGGLYQWAEMMNYSTTPGVQGICPTNWHLPTDPEWTALTTYLGGESVAGGKMKETGATHWNSPNTGATNSSGFTGLPGGYRNTDWAFSGYSNNGLFWSSTDSSTADAWSRELNYSLATLDRSSRPDGYGISVRCLRDDTTSTIPTVTTSSISIITRTTATSGGNVTSDGGATVIERGVCWSTSPNPNISNSKTIDGNGAGVFISYLTNLLPSTLYYVKAYATNSVGTTYGEQVSFTTLEAFSWVCGDNFTDSRDSKVYTTVQIGPQCWMKQNLNIGTRIAGANNQTNNGVIQKYCYNDLETNCNIYGGLYQWKEMMNYSTGVKGICPTNWHLPTDAEWTALTTYLGGESVAGGKMKETGSAHWASPNTGATNSSGFTGLPGGFRNTDLAFYSLNHYGGFWSSTAIDVTYAWKRSLYNYDIYVNRNNDDKGFGYSVRCLRDNSTLTIPTVTTSSISSITKTTATSGGTVTSDGGAYVTERGVCWSTSPNPNISNSKTIDGNGFGIFISNLTNLLPNTLYYVKAYATNIVGTAYGEQVSFTTMLGIGSGYGGGIIFYIDDTGQHGLISATTDQGYGAQWGCLGTTISGADGTAIGTGNQNTIDIEAGCPTAGIAADICANLTLGGYSDWFLPSKDELNQMYLQRAVIGGFTSAKYWSSSEYSNGFAWSQYLYSSGGQYFTNKNFTLYVRCIRNYSTPTIPTVTTSSISNITQTTATSGGNITSDGGATVTQRGVCWSTSPNPNISSSKTIDGNGTGIFISNLTNLLSNTVYYVKAYATNSVGTAYGEQVSFTTLAFSWACGSNFTDSRDGKVYTTVQIGDQCWIKQNLNIGARIVGTTEQTNNNAIEKYCYDNLEINCDIYGGLYQWDEMMNYSTTAGVQGICPTNWHLPTDAEWTNLTTFLGGESFAGGKMKTTGTIEEGTGLWKSPNTEATNSSGFTGLPGGYRHADGSFLNLGEYGIFWSSIESSTADAWSRHLNYSLATVNRSASPEGYGISVRCLRDANSTSTIPTVTTSSISSITQTNATSGGNVTSDGGATVTERGVCWSTAPNPNISNSKTIEGNGTGIFISNLTNLLPNTLYYVKAYATNSMGTAYGEQVSFTTLVFAWACGSNFTDSRDGKVYTTVQIGPQCWIKKNLNIGTRIAGANNQTNNGNIEKYCYNDLETNCDIYGGLYQWAEMMKYSTTPGVQGICPTNWHLPTDAEWTALTTYLGGESVAGGRMKETGTTHWNSPNTGATDSSGFTGLPGGYRNTDWAFSGCSNNGHFWSSTAENAAYAWNRILYDSYMYVNRYNDDMGYGYSVRCLNDDTTSTIPTVTTSSISIITRTTATSGGNVTSDGGATVIERGVCWSTSPNPNTSNSKTIDGNGIGNYISNLANLLPNTLYYVKAYATNIVGTAYGEQVSFTTLLAIGSSYGGGIIFYIDGTGQHGLISATTDQSAGLPWGCLETTISGADGTAIGTGNQNTIDIEVGCTTSGIAADICANLTLGGYSDWFLPSKDELNQMYVQRAAIGGFASALYWSSSEFSSLYAWTQYFSNGNQNTYLKGNTNSVRAVRAF